MKRIFILLLAAAIAAGFTACQLFHRNEEPSEPEPSSQEELLPDPSTPAGAIAELLESAKQWDTDTVNRYLPEGIDTETSIPEELRGLLQQSLERLEYKVGEANVDGNRARVETEITSVNAESAVTDAAAAVVGYVAKQKLTGKNVDDYTEITRIAIDAIDASKLPLVTSSATAYLIQDQDGTWKLDLEDEKNLPFLNAVSGGSIEMTAKIKNIAAEYGIAPR